MHDYSRYQAVARSGVCRKKCRRHEMFIDEKCSWFSRSSELSEKLGISLNSQENKMGVRASYKHYAATRLFFRQTSPRAGCVNYVICPLKGKRASTYTVLRKACSASCLSKVESSRTIFEHERRIMNMRSSLVRGTNLVIKLVVAFFVVTGLTATFTRAQPRDRGLGISDKQVKALPAIG